MNIFAEPMKQDDGTWIEMRLGRLLRESRAALALNPVSWLGFTGYLLLLDNLGMAVVLPELEGKRMQPITRALIGLAGMSPGEAAGVALLASGLMNCYSLPAGFQLDNEPGNPVIVIGAPNTLKPGDDGITAIDIGALVALVEQLAAKVQAGLDAGTFKLDPNYTITLTAK